MLRPLFFWGLGAAVAASLSQAQVTFPQPYLQALDPVAFQTSGLVVLTPSGSALDSLSSMSLRHLADPSKVYSLELSAVKGSKGKWEGRLPAGMAEGWYDARLIGAHGSSNPRAVCVTKRVITASNLANDTQAKAQRIPLEGVVHGVFKAGQAQWFELELKKGQVVQGWFNQGQCDSRVTLMGQLQDSAGRVVGRLRSGSLHALIAADGRYLLKLYDMMYGGSVDHHFVFEMGVGPRVWAANSRSVAGWNLPGARSLNGVKVDQGVDLQWVDLAAPAPAWLQQAISSARPLVLPEGLSPPETATDRPQRLSLPALHAGWFAARGGVVLHEVAVKKGERLWVDVLSQALGFETDAVLTAQWLAAGKTEPTLAGEVNDAAPLQPPPSTRWFSLDPALSLEAPADGVLLISLIDPGNAANGRRLPYLLSVRRPADPIPTIFNQLEVGFFSAPPPAAATAAPIASGSVQRGGVALLEVFVAGRHAQSPAQKFQIEPLPPGVVAASGGVGAGKSLGFLSYTTSTTLGTSSIALPFPQRLHTTVWPVADTGREVVSLRTAGGAVLGVADAPTPVQIQPSLVDGSVISASGKLQLKVRLTRNPQFQDALKLKLLGLTDPAKAPELSIAANANEGTISLDLKAFKLPTGAQVVYLQGTAKMATSSAVRQIDDLKSQVAKAQQLLDARTSELKKTALPPAELAAKTKAEQETLNSKIKELNALTKANPAKDLVMLVHSPALWFEVR